MVFTFDLAAVYFGKGAEELSEVMPNAVNLLDRSILLHKGREQVLLHARNKAWY